MDDIAKWFNDTLKDFEDNPEFQGEIIMLLNEYDEEPVLRNQYDGD